MGERYDDIQATEAILERLLRVRERIFDAGREPESVRLVAVTKGQPLRTVLRAVGLGLVDLGGSYGQELVDHAEGVAEADEWSRRRTPPGLEHPPAPAWHFVGNLQRKKVRLAAPHVQLWQSVDRLSLAAEIARRAPGATVLVQVNVTGLPQQGGCPPERVAAVAEGCRDLGLEVQGLMAIGAQGDPGDTRASFRTVRRLADQLALPIRSMGMSGDLEAAVAEGSTMVRVGTALFGPRGGHSAVRK